MEIIFVDYNDEIKEFIKKNHYLKTLPVTCLASIGLFLDDKLKGVALFAEPIRAFAAKKYVNKIELIRFVVSDDMEKNTESMFLSTSMDLIESTFPYDGVITYSDTTEGHEGCIYKACNFMEAGKTKDCYHYINAQGIRIDNYQVWKKAKENNVHEAVQAYIDGLKKEKDLSKIIFLYLFNRNIPLSHKLTYTSWYQMKQRCLNKKYKNFDYYGGRGINIDNKWLDFYRFIEDMGLRPSAIHTLDRINNEGNYCKENCRWTNHTEQNKNTSRNILIEFNGKKKCLMDWSIEYNIGYQALRERLKKGINPPELFNKTSKSHLQEPIQDKCKLCDNPVHNLKHGLCYSHYKRRDRENAAIKQGKQVPEIRDGSYKKLKNEVLNLEHKIRFDSKKNKEKNYGIYFSEGHNKWVAFVYLLDGKKVSFVQFKNQDEAFNFRESLKARYIEKYGEIK